MLTSSGSFCINSAPAPVALASTCTWKANAKFGTERTGAVQSRSLAALKARVHSKVHESKISKGWNNGRKVSAEAPLVSGHS